MIIGLDIGNTHTVTAIYDDNGKIILNFRIATNEKMTEDEYFSYFRNITKFNNIDIKCVKEILIASVVPNVISTYQFFAKKYFNKEPLLISLDSDSNIKIPFTFIPGSNPTGFGADRIIDIVESIKKYPDKNLIIFDFGTATTYEVLKKGVYVGGGIMPGIEMSINALCSNTANCLR